MNRGWPFVVLRETGPQLPVLSHCGSCNTRHAAKQSATLGQISLEHARVLNYWQGSRVVLHDWAKSTGECTTTACRGDLKASVEADTPELFAEPPSILNGTLRANSRIPTMRDHLRRADDPMDACMVLKAPEHAGTGHGAP